VSTLFSFVFLLVTSGFAKPMHRRAHWGYLSSCPSPREETRHRPYESKFEVMIPRESLAVVEGPGTEVTNGTI
jgi:hypothetical protein